MVVLGIESSCDETSAAVLEGPWNVRSNVIASQTELHAPYGGVVPEIASRRHVELVTAVIQEALEQAEIGLDRIEGLAVTNRPGLIGSLLVGVAAAKSLSLARDLPLIGVHHIEGHVFSPFVAAQRAEVPAVALVASGGHTELYYVRELHDYSVLGRRRDDAAERRSIRVLASWGSGAVEGQRWTAPPREAIPKPCASREPAPVTRWISASAA
jgi:N6-L-threonylcarbamoyladenine synthase